MNKKTVFLTKASLTGALYAVLTLLSAVFGLAYSGVQFRFSEALCVLPVFSRASIPGLTVGCLIANIFSSVTPLDMLVGTAATFLAAVCTRRFRSITFKGIPLLSMLFPVIFNGIFVGFEIALVSGTDAFLSVFVLQGLSVMAGEGAVVFILGTVLILIIRKNDRLRQFIAD